MLMPEHVILSDLDIAFADMLQRKHPSDDDAWCLAALTSHAYQKGHACLLLSDALNSLVLVNKEGVMKGCLSADWSQQQTRCHWWTTSETTQAPLVWQSNRLYLYRAWQDETVIREQITQRLSINQITDLVLLPLLSQLFEHRSENDIPDWQAIACALACRSQMTIITGGPGTGKTTTVVKLLALLQKIHLEPLNIQLAAPTGKAATRIADAIQNTAKRLPQAFQSKLPTQAQTLHKLLMQESLAGIDCLIVDEASMIDLPMMAKLMRQLPLSTRLILLGDKDQLASVDAGAVLGQLCEGAEQGNYHHETISWIAAQTGITLPNAYQGQGSQLAQQTIMLRHSHRFDGHSAIGQWATAVNKQAVASVQSYWQNLPDWSETSPDAVQALRLPKNGMQQLQAIIQHAWHKLQHYVNEQHASDSTTDDWALRCLGQLAEFQLLCATREGPWGISAMNQRIAHWLGLTPNAWMPGRVVMITRNNYTLNLMNGDIGICLLHPTKGISVAFQTTAGIRWILPIRLSQVEDAFAMTVHKSQGSEFTRVLLLLPEQDSPILTKELIYTGITRAKQQLIIACPNPNTLFSGTNKAINRLGGLSFAQ